MNGKEKGLREQEAPLKNTDHAFVQVGHNGEPVVPEIETKDEEANRLTKQSEPEK